MAKIEFLDPDLKDKYQTVVELLEFMKEHPEANDEFFIFLRGKDGVVNYSYRSSFESIGWLTGILNIMSYSLVSQSRDEEDH